MHQSCCLLAGRGVVKAVVHLPVCRSCWDPTSTRLLCMGALGTTCSQVGSALTADVYWPSSFVVCCQQYVSHKKRWLCSSELLPNFKLSQGSNRIMLPQCRFSPCHGGPTCSLESAAYMSP